MKQNWLQFCSALTRWCFVTWKEKDHVTKKYFVSYFNYLVKYLSIFCGRILDQSVSFNNILFWKDLWKLNGSVVGSFSMFYLLNSVWQISFFIQELFTLIFVLLFVLLIEVYSFRNTNTNHLFKHQHSSVIYSFSLWHSSHSSSFGKKKRLLRK